MTADRFKRWGQEQGSRLLTAHGAWLWRLVLKLAAAPRLGGKVVILRHADARDVLAHPEVFRVTYLQRMEDIAGPFILGWDPQDTPRYDIEHAWLRAGAHVAPGGNDVARLAERARQVAAARIAQGGELDVVADLTDPVLDDAIATYVGVRAARLDWARAVFYGVFLNFAGVPAVKQEARDAAAALRREIAAAADARDPQSDDLLGRLLAAEDSGRGLDRAAVERNLVGLITAWVGQVSRLLPLALDVLLRHEAELAQARAAARDGDVGRVGAYLWEAARFRAQNPLVARRSVTEHTLPSGATIPQGAGVLVMLQAAMMDPAAVANPGRFRAGRDERAYLHFGDGLHRCFGEYVARAQLAAMGTELFACEGLRRAGGVRWKGPFPARLRVLI
jgi:cytochrome P450